MGRRNDADATTSGDSVGHLRRPRRVPFLRRRSKRWSLLATWALPTRTQQPASAVRQRSISPPHPDDAKAYNVRRRGILIGCR